jgi:Helix-turn-helix domain
MAGEEVALEIRVLHRHGKGIREIAREIGSSRNTVRRYLLDESARYKPRPRRATKLDPFKDYVVERLTSAAPERIPAKQMQVDWAVIRRGSNRLFGVCCDPGVEPGLLCRVCQRRAGRNSDPGARGRLSGVPRDAARGAVRQYAHGRAAAARLWPGSTPLSSGVSRLCAALRFPAAAMRAVSGTNGRQGGAVHPLSARELLGPTVPADWPRKV